MGRFWWIAGLALLLLPQSAWSLKRIIVPAVPPPEPTGITAKSPDGKVTASVNKDGSVSLLDVASGNEIRRFTGHSGTAIAVGFTADGEMLALESREGTIHSWRVATGTVADLRNFSHPKSTGDAKELQALWEALAGKDVIEGQRATIRLSQLVIHAPRVAVPFLRTHLASEQNQVPKRLAGLIVDLDDDDFSVRESATRELERMGVVAAPALRAVIAGKASVEACRRAQFILKRFGIDPEELRQVRVVRMLECNPTREAKELLETVAKGPETSPLAQAARAAWGRRLTREQDRVLQQIRGIQPVDQRPQERLPQGQKPDRQFRNKAVK